MENADRVGSSALGKLRAIQSRHPAIGDVRGLGLMIGVEFIKDQKNRKPDPAFRDRVEHHAFENGLLTLGCGQSVIRISPPLCMTEQEMDEGLAIFEQAITLAEKE
jgi:4-aminobutyrate aminotransferase